MRLHEEPEWSQLEVVRFSSLNGRRYFLGIGLPREVRSKPPQGHNAGPGGSYKNLTAGLFVHERDIKP